MCVIRIFPSWLISCRIKNTQSMQDNQQVQIVHATIYLIIFWSHMKILLIIKWKFLCSSNGHISPLNYLDHWIDNDSRFWARRPISLKHVSFWCLFSYPHLTTYHSDVGLVTCRCYVWIKHISLRWLGLVQCQLTPYECSNEIRANVT